MDQRRHGDGGRRSGASRAGSGTARATKRLPHRHDTIPTGTRQLPRTACPHAGWLARPARHHDRARRPGGRVDSQRPVPAGRQPARGSSHGDRPRPAALRQSRVLQRRAGGAGARRVQRPHHCAARRAADRFEADQQQPAALDRGAGRQPAPARDLRRRRQVHPRLDRRAARPDGAVLPPQPRPLARDGAEPRDVRLRGRDPRPHAAPRRAGAARPPGPRRARLMLDAARLRADFPLLERRENGRRLVYLDNAATTQKPEAVLSAIADYYRTTNANVHRGADSLAIRATEAYEAARVKVDVQTLDCDFYALSGHKMLAPMGSGALVAKPELLEAMPPYHGGGEMISRVFDDHSTYNKIPHKFEAGTPNVEAAVGLAAAIDYLERIGPERIAEHEQALAQAAIDQLTQIDGVTVYGPRGHRAGVVSFTYGDIHPHDIATILDQDGVCIRAGHHCTQPLMRRLNVPATARASFYIYNDLDDVAALAGSLVKAGALFGYVPA